MFGRKKREKRPEHFAVWKNGRLMLPQDRTCVGLNVYLGRKNQGGIRLRGVKKVLLPTVAIRKNNIIDPMTLILTFRSWEEAEDVIKETGKPCAVEIRIADQHLSEANGWIVHGDFFVLETVPLKIAPEPLIDGGSIEVEVRFLVSRYTANDEKGTERWSFEWKPAKAGG